MEQAAPLYYLITTYHVMIALFQTIFPFCSSFICRILFIIKYKNLAKTILNYGAASQEYFNYYVDSLANSDLTINDKKIDDIPNIRLASWSTECWPLRPPRTWTASRRTPPSVKKYAH